MSETRSRDEGDREVEIEKERGSEIVRDRKRERNSKVERIRVCVCVCLCKREMERVGTESVNAKTFYSLHQIFYQGLHSDYICVLLLKAPCHGRPISILLHYRLVSSLHSHPILLLILV